MERGLSVHYLSFKPGTELKRLTLSCITKKKHFFLLISKYWDSLQHPDFPGIGIHVKEFTYAATNGLSLSVQTYFKPI